MAPYPMLEGAPRVGIIVASPEEQRFFRPAEEVLKKIGCPYDLIDVTMAWLGPSAADFLGKMRAQGWGAVIVAAGLEPQAPAFVAHLCDLPVIAVPLEMGAVERECTMRLILHTMGGAPVAIMPPNGEREAAVVAMRILALGNRTLAERLGAYERARLASHTPDWPQRESRSSGGAEGAGHEDGLPANFTGEEAAGRVRPVDFDRPLEGQPLARVEPGVPEAALPPPRQLGLRAIDAEAPDAMLVEEAVDCLLEGGVVALPTDTVYGLAVDATNAAAVGRLYELKGRPPGKAITLLVDSPKLLASIACNLTTEIRRLMEAFWPGPLTMILTKRGASSFRHITTDQTIGVRLPDHAVPLALIQALARPLACTSANVSGEPDALSADDIRAAFGERVHCVLDVGQLDPSPPSTVLDVTREPYRIMRLGAVTHDQLAAIVGDKLEAEPDA